MADLEAVKARVVFLLGDDPDEGDSSYPDDLLVDAVHAAHDAILPYVWKPKTDSLTAALSTFTLPTDLYEVQAVWDESVGTFIDPAILTPGEPSASDTGNAWFEYPSGTLNLYNAIGSSGGTLYYAATWSKPTQDADVLEVPEYALTGLTYYGASYATLNKASSAARLGNYKTRQDSGNPEHNPLLTYSNFLLKRFEYEMARMPKITKGMR
jgi:hypothetical protein